MVPAEHTAEIVLSSLLVQGHGVGLLGHGHLHMSNAFQDIKCHVNIAPPPLPHMSVCCHPSEGNVTDCLLDVEISHHILLEPFKFFVLILDSCGVTISGTTKEHWQRTWDCWGHDLLGLTLHIWV